MSNIKFFNFNLVNQRVTDILEDVGGANAFFPVTNIADDRTTKVYRSPDGVLLASVVFDFKTVEDVDSVLVVPDSVNGNFGFTSLTIEANATNVWGAPAFTTALVPNDEEGFGFKAFPIENYRFWRITGVNTSGFVEISKVFIGKAVELLENNWGMGWTRKLKDRSTSQENNYGQEFWNLRNKIVTYRGGFELLTPTEFETILGIYEANGRHTPCWVMMDQEGVVFDTIEKFSAYGKLANDPPQKNQAFKLFDMPMVIKQSL